MLRDIDRKVLRILYNTSLNRTSLPLLRALSVKTGKGENEILFILRKLHDSGFIIWDQLTSNYQIIKAWDNDADVKAYLQYSGSSSLIGKI